MAFVRRCVQQEQCSSCNAQGTSPQPTALQATHIYYSPTQHSKQIRHKTVSTYTPCFFKEWTTHRITISEEQQETGFFDQTFPLTADGLTIWAVKTLIIILFFIAHTAVLQQRGTFLENIYIFLFLLYSWCFVGCLLFYKTRAVRYRAQLLITRRVQSSSLPTDRHSVTAVQSAVICGLKSIKILGNSCDHPVFWTILRQKYSIAHGIPKPPNHKQ